MSTLESLVTEWRDAREAILSADWKDPARAGTNVLLWDRLANAEDALMAHARTLPLAPMTWCAMPDGGRVIIDLPDTVAIHTGDRLTFDVGAATYTIERASDAEVQIIPPGPYVDPHQRGAEPEHFQRGWQPK